MIKSIWNWVSHLGVHDFHSEENSLTILYNRMSLFSVITLTSFSIYLWFSDIDPIFPIIVLMTSLFYSSILILNGLGKIYWARLCTSLGTVIWVSLYHLCFSGFFSQSLAVGAAIIINYVAFRKKERYLKLLFAIHAGIYVMALLYGIIHGPLIELTDYPPVGLVSFFVSMAWVMLSLIVFHREKEILIENLKAKNRELEQTTIELERFTYIASHDLKSPLRTIVSFAGMINRDISKGNYEAVKSNMHFVMSGAKQMDSIIQGVLELSRLKEIDQSERSKVDLNEILEITKTNLIDEINNKKVDIRSDQLPSILGNKVEFLLLFQNLIQNAIKYNTRKKPVISISSAVSPDNLSIAFEDNGIGIEKKFHTQIFDFFKRLHSSSEYEGTGIGLGLCKRVVDNYNGTIQVDSKLGSGTTFTVQLPRENGLLLL